MDDSLHGPRRWLRRGAPCSAMLAGVVVVGLLPFIRFRQFYLAGDSIAQWLPVSRRIGELVRNGESHLMDPSLWRGGNFVAEARFGVWNPVALLIDSTVLQLDDLAVAALLANLAYLLILSTGVYVLAREYGASAWASALGGVVAASGGWTLWMDASWWTPHLASFAFTPFVWAAARRLARGVGGPGWLVLAGALCVTAGNPYSNVVVGVIVIAVAVEFGDRHRLTTLWPLGGSLLAIALIAVFVYLPFRQTSGVGFRETGVFNDGSWAPGAGGLVTLSTPTASPHVRHFGRDILGFPGFYLAWFVIPLAPWLRWRTLARRDFAGFAVFGGVFLMLLLGPSNLWFFRWPMRLVPYVYLPALIGSVVVLGSGLVADRPRRRAAASGSLVAAGAYVAWADVPEDLGWHVAGGAAVLTATAVVIVVGIRRQHAMIAAMMVATLLMLAFQLLWRPHNQSVRHYAMPSSAADYEDLAARYDGTVVQIASYDDIPPGERRAEAAYGDLALGSTYAIAGIETVSAYSGIGFSTHDAALCLGFDGSMCADAWNRLWMPATGTDRLLVDLIAADTIVVQRTILDTAGAPTPIGWERTDVTDTAVVWQRADAGERPIGRLSDVSGPVVVEADDGMEPHREVVRFRRSDPGPAELTFARLAWPGYEATIDGRSLLVGGGPAGLLTVTIPSDVDAGEVQVTWVPPYWRPSLLVLTLGLLVGAGTQVLWWRLGVRRPGSNST